MEFLLKINSRGTTFIRAVRVTVGKTRWYSCLDHHKICQDCKEVKNVKNCGFEKISINFCAVIEELLKDKSMKFKCTNTSRGCNRGQNGGKTKI